MAPQAAAVPLAAGRRRRSHAGILGGIAAAIHGAAEKLVPHDDDELAIADSEDDFGLPENAFNFCSFWYINALAVVGRRDEAKELFEHMLELRTPQGLLSEDLDPRTGELWGNYPQTYSLVGIVNSAMRLSRSWEDAL